MICLIDGCERRARPDWTLCERHASDLITAAFGTPTPRAGADARIPLPSASAPAQAAGKHLARPPAA